MAPNDTDTVAFNDLTAFIDALAQANGDVVVADLPGIEASLAKPTSDGPSELTEKVDTSGNAPGVDSRRPPSNFFTDAPKGF